jgi:hypothetical protein
LPQPPGDPVQIDVDADRPAHVTAVHQGQLLGQAGQVVQPERQIHQRETERRLLGRESQRCGGDRKGLHEDPQMLQWAGGGPFGDRGSPQDPDSHDAAPRRPPGAPARCSSSRHGRGDHRMCRHHDSGRGQTISRRPWPPRGPRPPAPADDAGPDGPPAG